MSTLGAEAQSLESFVWSMAEMLRGDRKQSEHGRTEGAVTKTFLRYYSGNDAQRRAAPSQIVGLASHARFIG